MNRGAPPPRIGSALWARELFATFGVTGEQAERFCELGMEGGSVNDAHSVSILDLRSCSSLADSDLLGAVPKETESRLALVAAAWVLFHQANPGYAAQMYLRINGWYEAQTFPRVKRWLMRQLASMICHGPESVCEAAWYVIGVDYFEDHRDSPIAFASLVQDLDPSYYRKILASSSYVLWAAKHEFYSKLAGDEQHHEALGRALTRSCDSDFLGSIDLSAARDLASRLRLSPETREALEEELRAEFSARLLGVVTDPQLCRVLIAIDAGVPSWFEGARVHFGPKLLGIVRVFRDRFGPAALDLALDWREGRKGEESFDPERIDERQHQWHCVDGDPSAWLEAVGKDVVVRGG